MRSEHWARAESLSAARHCSCFILTDEQRTQFSQNLAELPIVEATLRKYYEDFNEVSAPEAGVVMSTGIAYLRSVLDAIDPGTLALLIVG